MYSIVVYSTVQYYTALSNTNKLDGPELYTSIQYILYTSRISNTTLSLSVIFLFIQMMTDGKVCDYVDQI